MSSEYFIEPGPDGRYRVLKPHAERASAAANTQAEAIAAAKALDPDATLHVARVRQRGPGPDKYRKVK